MKHTRLSLALLGLLVAGCTVYVTPGDVSVSGRVRFGIEVSDIIQVFEPSRGAGSTYYVGETIAFRVRTIQDGYLTLTALDPDGSVYTFAQNIFIRGGHTIVIDGPSPGYQFSLVPPRGPHRVRVAFSSTPTSGRITYRSISGETAWTQSIVVDLNDAPVRDIAETRFYLQ